VLEVRSLDFERILELTWLFQLVHCEQGRMADRLDLWAFGHGVL
jgi:hypothetical protein